MLNFVFANPTKIIFGKGEISAISKDIPGAARILITYGGGSVISNGVMAQVRSALHGRYTVEFGGIEPNPDFATLMKAVVLARSEKIDFLLAVGGGSVLDGTKFIAAATLFEGDPWDLLARGAAVQKAIPIGSVLTLPATGSESNGGSVISRRETGDKLFFGSPLLYPRFAVLDPLTTYSLSPRQVANGVVDAFVHTMEQYLTYPVGGVVQDRLAEGLLLTLIEQGPLALAHPTDYDVRSNTMWAATLALNGLIGAGVPQDWTTHMIGHEITALYGLDHAQTLAIVLPAVMTIMKQDKLHKIQQYGERVWHLSSRGDKLADEAIEATTGFFQKMGVLTRLSDYKIGPEACDKVITQLKKHGHTKLGEAGGVDLITSRRILEACL